MYCDSMFLLLILTFLAIWDKMEAVTNYLNVNQLSSALSSFSLDAQSSSLCTSITEELSEAPAAVPAANGSSFIPLPAPKEQFPTFNTECQMARHLSSESYLQLVRDQLALYQEGRGISRGHYSFVTLMAALVAMVSQSIHSVVSLMLTLAPIPEIGLHVLRFSLESMLDIKRTKNYSEMMKKILIFVLQLGLALSMVSFVFMSILYPVFLIGISVGLKTMALVTGRMFFI